MSRRVLLVTNDFPPRQGGIQSFLFELVRRLPPDEIAVFCSDYSGSAEFDAALEFPVFRHPTGMLLPTPGVRRRAVALAAELGSRTAWFGAAAPLGLLGRALRTTGVEHVVATTHGHEIGWAQLPGARQLLQRIATDADVVTYLGEYTRRRLEPVVGSRTELRRLTPGVDVDAFHPGVDGEPVRRRHGLLGRPVIGCISRLVPRKGQDILIDCLPAIRRSVPNAALLIVGRGPYEQALRRRAAAAGVTDHVVFTGAVEQSELAAHYAAGDVFAMPCRTRRLGLDVEGLGMVFLEASASGRPVVAGRSGGAPETVQEGITGRVVDGRSTAAVTAAVTDLLLHSDRAAQWGKAGRVWVENEWRWDAVVQQLAELLRL